MAAEQLVEMLHKQANQVRRRNTTKFHSVTISALTIVWATTTLHSFVVQDAHTNYANLSAAIVAVILL